jgi:hypothetical protein
MNRRLAKFYLAVVLFCSASYLLWTGVEEWVGVLPAEAAPLRTDLALPVSLLGLGLASNLGWKTILEELSVTSD